MKEAFKEAILTTLVVQNKESFDHTWKKMEPLLRKVFKSGEMWGVTYSTWFTPTTEDTDKAFQNSINQQP